MLKLKPKEIELLKACLNEHRPDLLWVVDSPHIVTLDHKLGGELLNAVGIILYNMGYGLMKNRTRMD